MAGVSRRKFIASGTLAAGALAFGPSFWRSALAAPARVGPGPYGALGAPDANGLSLPSGFRAREIARAGRLYGPRAYPWHIFSDGQATFSVEDGGWVLVSNSESLAAFGGGSSAIRFGADGEMVDAYRILAGTNANCAGGRTPWGTWLSCEEHPGGQVWEADPLGRAVAVDRPSMGFFKHEAAAVDPVDKRVYMTEDERNGAFYRFTPAAYPDLSAGLLEVLVGSPGGAVTWEPVPDPSAIFEGPTRDQVPGAARFSGGEGIWYDSGAVYFSAKGENRIYSYDTRSAVLDVMFDGRAESAAGLTGLDNLCVSRSGDLFVCEDNDDPEFSIGIVTREGEVAKFLTASGPIHADSELAGVVFDPSGTRMYFASQRAHGHGAVYEVTGPFRREPPPGAEEEPAGEPAPLDPKEPPSLGTDPPTGGEPGGGASGPAPSGGSGPRGGSDRGPLPIKLRVGGSRRLSNRGLLKRGTRVAVRIERPGVVTVALRTSDVDYVGGSRGSTERPRTVTLARTRKRFRRAGRYKIRLEVRGGKRRRLTRTPSITARFTVQAKAGDDAIQVVNRAVKLVGAKRRS